MTRERQHPGGWLRAAGAVAALLATASVAHAQGAVRITPDVTATLGTVGPATLTDDDVAEDDAAGTLTPVLGAMLAAVPPEAEIAGLETSSTLPALLSLDITTPLPGLPPGSPAEPRDVVEWDPIGFTFSYNLDGSAAGVPADARIDAVSRNTAGSLLLSFETTVVLAGVGTVDDEDLVERFGGFLFLMEFDGSANGVPAGLDLDAASRPSETDDILLLSFDGSGVIAGIPFDDEDTLAFDPGTATWAMYADASLSDPVDYPTVDVIALPEPGANASLLAGAMLLALLARLTGRSSVPRGASANQ